MPWVTPKTWVTGEVLTSADMNSYLTDNLKFIKSEVETNAQTGTSYTLAVADAGKVIELSNAAAITLTVPTNTTAAIPVGSVITIIQTGAGQVTISPAGTVTVNAAGSRLKLGQQWSAATLVKRATNTWVAFGDLAA